MIFNLLNNIKILYIVKVTLEISYIMNEKKCKYINGLWKWVLSYTPVKITITNQEQVQNRNKLICSFAIKLMLNNLSNNHYDKQSNISYQS